MIKINNKEYILKVFNCCWGNTKKGLAPNLYFLINEECNNKELFFELSITDKELKNMIIGKELEINKSITDIGYNYGIGWLTLIDSDYIFKVTKFDSDRFLINFKCEDSFENLFFEINEEINLKFPKEN